MALAALVIFIHKVGAKQRKRQRPITRQSNHSSKGDACTKLFVLNRSITPLFRGCSYIHYTMSTCSDALQSYANRPQCTASDDAVPGLIPP